MVLDVRDDAPLPGATLRVAGTTRVTVSDGEGRFVFRDVPAGTWVLEVTAPGFQAHTFPMDVEPGGFADVVIRMAPLDSAGAEAGSRASVRPGPGRPTFDWSMDPEGHRFGRAFLGAAAGNAVGLAAGLAVGRQCVFIEDRTDEIEFSCGDAGVAGVGVAAVALPALGSALGARVLGRTDRSRGRLVPALVGAGMGVLPGYIFSLSTVGDGVGTMNAVGKAFLLVGTPLLTALADRMHRTLR